MITSCRRNSWRSYLWVWLILVMAWLATSAHAASEIKTLRLGSTADATRLVFDLSAPVVHQVFTLSEPHRVVVDFADCKLVAKPSSLALPDKGLKKMRYGYRTDQNLRVVLDVDRQVNPKAFLLPPTKTHGHRLVLDLGYAAANVTQAVVEPVSEPVVIDTTSSSNAVPVLTTAAGNHHLRDIIVAIDAGHGGHDPGAIGRNGTREKDVVLSIARYLHELIAKERGVKSFLTRGEDKFLSLRTRTGLASSRKADIFISIHADAAVDRRVTGSSVYVLSPHGATSEAARILAQRENDAGMVGGISLEDKDPVLKSVLVDLSQTATIEASIDLAEKVARALNKVGKVRRPIEQAGFVVLKSPDIPSILVETAFISNPKEEKRLRSADHQRALAKAILEGIKTYFAQRAPTGTLLANSAKSGRHVTKQGETLSEIALRYHVKVSDLRKCNSLKSERVRVGQVLLIPIADR